MSRLVEVVDIIQNVHGLEIEDSAVIAASDWSKGVIKLNYGLIKKIGYTDDEITAVLFHELGHIIDKRCYTDCSVHNHNMEYRADEYAAKMTNRPEDLIHFLLRTERYYAARSDQSWHTHPSTIDRAYNLGLDGNSIANRFNNFYQEK